jgi:hypothetical protein
MKILPSRVGRLSKPKPEKLLRVDGEVFEKLMDAC